MIYPIVLAGQAEPAEAAGEHLPVHFHRETMIESRFQMVLRGVTHPMFAAPTVVTCEAYRFVAAQQMQAASVSGEIVIEPCQSNPAAALAAVALRFQHDPEAVLLVLPADYYGAERDSFHHALEAALPSAFAGNLVLLAEANSHVATRYGQVQPLCRGRIGAPVQALFTGASSQQVDTRALGNSGVYLIRAGSLLAAFKRYAPRLLQSTKRAVEDMWERGGFLRLAPEAYDRLRREDFETAILSRMKMVVALPCDHQRFDPLDAWYQDAESDRTAAMRQAGEKRSRAAGVMAA